MSESQTALIFYLKFANINFPRVRKRTVTDPDLQIRGGGPGLKKNIFFWSKNKGEAAGLPVPSPGSATGEMWTLTMNRISFSFARRYFQGISEARRSENIQK